MVNLFSKVTVTGTMKDAVGREHRVDVLLDDLPEWLTLSGGAHNRYLDAPDLRTAKALEKIEKKLK